jgi:hypothetical protein
VGDMPSPGCVRERAWTAYDMHVDADSCSGCVRVRVRACVCALESGSEGGRRAQEGGRSSRPTKQIPRSVRVDAICFCKRLAASTVKRASNPKFKWRSVESENKAANLALSAMADRPCRPRNNTCRGHCQQQQWERSADASDTFTAQTAAQGCGLDPCWKKKGCEPGRWQDHDPWSNLWFPKESSINNLCRGHGLTVSAPRIEPRLFQIDHRPAQSAKEVRQRADCQVPRRVRKLCH